VTAALVHRRPPQGLIHHSDRGVQYASVAYRKSLKAQGVSAPRSCNSSIRCFFRAGKRQILLQQKLVPGLVAGANKRGATGILEKAKSRLSNRLIDIQRRGTRARCVALLRAWISTAVAQSASGKRHSSPRPTYPKPLPRMRPARSASRVDQRR
jgi:hypothetical protein